MLLYAATTVLLIAVTLLAQGPQRRPGLVRDRAVPAAAVGAGQGDARSWCWPPTWPATEVRTCRSRASSGHSGLMAIPLLIVVAQPDLGTASVFVAITMAVLLVAKANPRHIALVTGLALFSAILVVRHRDPPELPVRPAHHVRRAEPEHERRPADQGAHPPVAAVPAGHRRRRADRAGLHAGPADQGRLRARAAHGLRVLGHRRAVRPARLRRRPGPVRAS